MESILFGIDLGLLVFLAYWFMKLDNNEKDN